MAIPKRFCTAIKEIWEMQYHLEHYKRQKAIYLMTKRRFRAGYDLLVLRERVGDCSAGLEHRWNQLQNNHKRTLKSFNRKNLTDLQMTTNKFLDKRAES